MEIIAVEQGTPFQELGLRLDGKNYSLELSWNFRREVWAMNIFDADREQLYSISSLLLGAFPGLLNTHNPEFPQGAFSIIDSGNGNVEADLDSLGASHLLVFLTADELREL